MDGGFLTYGSERIACRPPGSVRTLLPQAGPPVRPEADTVRAALGSPDGTPPLRELARGRRSAIVLIACRTRRTGSHVFLPEIRRELNAAGLRDEDILVYTATGTHDNYREADAPLLAGDECARALRFAGHDCRDDLVEVGTTSRGNRVRLARAYVEADLKIATGRVTYHYFAGFTGGRKAILPGVSAFETITTNHRQASIADAEGVRLNPRTANGRLDDNPIHLDMLEAAKLSPPDFTLCTVCDSEDRILEAFGGDMEASHARATAIVGPGDAPAVDAPADWLFLSCGGAHLDVNGVQSIKAVLNSYEAVRKGGAIVLSAECAEGVAPWLREVCSQPPEELDRRIAAGELRHPHNALWMRRVRERAHVIMVTKLSEDEVHDLGFRKAESLDHAMALARELAGEPRRSYVVPFGNTTVVRVAS